MLCTAAVNIVRSTINSVFHGVRWYARMAITQLSCTRCMYHFQQTKQIRYSRKALLMYVSVCTSQAFSVKQFPDHGPSSVLDRYDSCTFFMGTVAVLGR